MVWVGDGDHLEFLNPMSRQSAWEYYTREVLRVLDEAHPARISTRTRRCGSPPRRSVEFGGDADLLECDEQDPQVMQPAEFETRLSKS